MLDNDLIQINISNIEELPQDYKVKLDDFIGNLKRDISTLVEVAENSGFWTNTIKKIIITNDYKGDIERQARIWNCSFKLTTEKEYVGISKTLYNNDDTNPEQYIFFPFSVASMKTDFHQVVLGQFISVFSQKIIKGELEKYNPTSYNFVTLHDFINYSLTIWLPINYSKRIEKVVFQEYRNELNADKILYSFCRKLKRNLYQYNSDEKDNHFRINRFWNKTYGDFINLISRFIEIKQTNGELKLKNELYLNIVLPILENINEITSSQLDNNSLSITLLKKNITNFFEVFNINLTEAEIGIQIKLTKDPKDYFIDGEDKIIDTEPRFVCFLDILGFSNMIDEYDEDLTSTVLQDIQEAFQESINSIETNENTPNKDILKHLRYQLFSDCVSISIPFFDREDDFLSNFNLISAFIRGFQLNMMVKGFFVRGGLSIGSYYSDKHMIFSKGLVNAYLLESKKAIYPRVLIDKKILEKLKNYQKSKIIYYGINDYLLCDWENYVFLNPFNLTKELVNQFERIKDEAKLDDNHEFSKTINSLMDLAFNLVKEPLKEIQNKEPEMIEIISNYIQENKRKYANSENILSKYIWIEELLKWIDNENSSELKFSYLYK